MTLRVTATSHEPGRWRPITVRVTGHSATWEPDTAVVFNGTGGACCGPATGRLRSSISFFTDADEAAHWAARNPTIVGPVLDQRQTLDLAVACFGGLLR